jgi:hypothetical protein
MGRIPAPPRMLGIVTDDQSGDGWVTKSLPPRFSIAIA